MSSGQGRPPHVVVPWTVIVSRQTRKTSSTAQRQPAEQRAPHLDLRRPGICRRPVRRKQFSQPQARGRCIGRRRNNQGPGVTEIGDEIVAQGVTINGLPLMAPGITSVSTSTISTSTIPIRDRRSGRFVIRSMTGRSSRSGEAQAGAGTRGNASGRRQGLCRSSRLRTRTMIARRARKCGATAVGCGTCGDVPSCPRPDLHGERVAAQRPGEGGDAWFRVFGAEPLACLFCGVVGRCCDPRRMAIRRGSDGRDRAPLGMNRG